MKGKAVGLLRMKKILVLMVMVSFDTINMSYAQGERNIWVSGFNAMIDFNSGTAQSIQRPSIGVDIWRTNASLCDKNGQLLFYTNGNKIFNKNYNVMQNGDSLECGEYTTDFGYNFMPSIDGSIIIPVVDDSEKYYIFYFDLNFYYELDGFTQYYPNHLLYSIVDMNLDSGNGAVVTGEKNISLLEDTLTDFGLQAVRHGNGRDWWLFCHEYGSNRYYYFLINPGGIAGPYSQNIGQSVLAEDATTYSPMRFSSQGVKFVHLFGESNSIELYTFDRCTGALIQWQTLALIDTFTIWPLFPAGVAFSPSDRYLYISDDLHRLYQYDLSAADIQSSQTLIDIYDSTYDPFSSWFDFMQNAPDGKIYMDEFNGNASLHVINQPDSAGIACNFIQHGFPLYPGTYWGGGMPNFPNYSLGSLYGSGCDTLSAVTTPTSTLNFHLTPNPASSYINIVYSVEHNATLTITNAYGIAVRQLTLYPYFKNRIVYVDDLAAGIYLVTLHEGNKISSQKMIVER